MKGALSLALWLALYPQGWSQVTVTRGPYLQRASTTGMVIRWRTNVVTSSYVFHGPAPGNLSTLSVDAPGTEHIVTLTGLKPGTKYFYAIGDDDGIHTGGDAEHFFYTAPPVGAERSVRIWAIGDSGTGGDGTGRAESVRDAYRNSASFAYNNVWLMLGDNAYHDGTDEEYQQAVFVTFRDLLRNTVLWPTFGNHDSYADGGITYFNIFTLPQQGESGGAASGTENYYSFDHANVHFVCLDSQGSSRAAGAPMLAWLADDLAATSQKWIIAFWHHPPYTKGSHDSDIEEELIEMRENVLPILDAGGVDLVLGGHSHSYERSFLIDGHYGHSTSLAFEMIRTQAMAGRAGTAFMARSQSRAAGRFTWCAARPGSSAVARWITRSWSPPSICWDRW